MYTHTPSVLIYRMPLLKAYKPTVSVVRFCTQTMKLSGYTVCIASVVILFILITVLNMLKHWIHHSGYCTHEILQLLNYKN